MNDHTCFANKSCYCYPCHPIPEGSELNCMQCFCCFYFTDCPSEASPTFIDVDGKTIKDCSNCTWIHNPDNYAKIMEYLTNKIFE